MRLAIGRPLLLIAFVVALIALIRFLPDLMRSDQPFPARAVETAQRPTNEASASVAAPGAAAPGPPLASRGAESPSGTVAMPVQITLQAPAAVNAGESFDVAVHVAAPNGLHRLMLAIRFNRKMLTLSGVSPGEFPRRELTPADLVVDEPSEGNLEVSLTVRNAVVVTGSGPVAVLHFESHRPGIVALAVPNVKAFDNTGAMRFRAEAPQTTSISIQ